MNHSLRKKWQRDALSRSSIPHAIVCERPVRERLVQRGGQKLSSSVLIGEKGKSRSRADFSAKEFIFWIRSIVVVKLKCKPAKKLELLGILIL